MSLRFRLLSPASCLLGTLLCALSLSGCREFSLIGECQDFAKTANASVTQWTELHERNKPTPQADIYETLATEFEAAQESLGGIAFKDPKLKQAVKKYTATLGQSSKHSKKYAKSLRDHTRAIDDQNDKAKRKAKAALARLRGEMKKVLRSHKSAMARINALCQPKR